MHTRWSAGTALCAALLIGAGCASSPKAVTPIVPDTAEHAVQAVAQLDAFALTGANGTLWWVTEDRKNISIAEAYETGMVLEERPDERTGYGGMAKALVQKIDAFMLSNGFAISPQNTSAGFQDETFYDFIAGYRKNDTVCALTINGDAYENTPVRFACSDRLKEFAAAQLPYLLALSDKDEVVISRIVKTTDQFVVVAVNARRTGYQAILKKTKAGYVQVYAGQEPPSCAIAEKNAIPLDVSGGCYEKDGATMRLPKQ